MGLANKLNNFQLNAHTLIVFDTYLNNAFFCFVLQGYGALYLLTAFPVIIGISVVLILFYNSLQ
jgi:hypothetical protein